jgi:hypothetical protein
MLLGQLKPGDIPAHVRDASIRKMVEVYFPANTVTDRPVAVKNVPLAYIGVKPVEVAPR